MEPTMLTCRILVVEDERIVALNLQQRLTKLGYDVPAIVASGEQALEQVESLRPDLVLMDINIEGRMDGIETARNIPSELDIPVVYLTAYSEDATLERARDTKPYGYLVKPFSERALHATIQMVLERRRTDMALRESEERLRLAMEAAEMGSWELDLASCKLLRSGPGLDQELFACTWDAFVARVHPGDRAQVADALDRSIAEIAPFQVEFRSRPEETEIRWFKVQGNVFASRCGTAGSRIVGVIQDVTARRNSDQRLRQAATVFETSPDGIVVLDHAYRILTANKRYCELVGMPLKLIVGERPRLLLEGVEKVDELREIGSALREQGRWSGELEARTGGRERHHILANLARVSDEGSDQAQYVAVFSDLTAIRAAERKLFHMAHHDPLTGLPNRMLARERLERAMERAKRLRSHVALLFIDLDYFKRINDTLGHQVGDEILRTIARRMQSCVRARDTVARQGGDEFMVILDPIDDIEDVMVVAKKIISALNQQIRMENTDLFISPSIGISLFPDNCDNIDDLISAADSAMYVAKEQGRNGYAFYDAEMTAEAARYMALDHDLRLGLKRGEFLLHYQPQYSLRTGEMVGVEALIRWQHPRRGLLDAEQIIPLAEDNGLIVDLGEWVLRTACSQACEWREAGFPRLRMAVNVSARQMRDERLVKVVKSALRENDLARGQLEIEITESTLQSGSNCLTTLQQLKDLGVFLAIDDFGTGYSCLSSLKYLPIDRVKIDRAFVRDLQSDPNDVAITDAIIAMAHRLNLQVVAEGVETLEQVELLRVRDCDEVQGYLYSKPIEAASIEDLLRAQTLRH
jgi:diguanylate cyclase (GGDEF)-like protein/PAS domain S-box-containing protein